MPGMDLKLEQLQIDPEAVSQQLEGFIKASVSNFKREGVIVGLSGGLDSSVVLVLSVAALGSGKVLGLIMPERDSSRHSERDARQLAEELGTRVERVELTPILEEMGIYRHIPRRFFASRKIASPLVKASYKLYTALTGERPLLRGLEGTNSGLIRRANAYYRMKHRLRMVLLYSYAERENRLVVGTANKTELLTGFFVKYGDSAADIMPLQSLYKTQVKQLAQFLKIPRKIINKAPSPDLIPGITDEFALGITYQKLDLILLGLDKNMGTEAIAKAGIKPETVDYVRELIKKSEHMRGLPATLD
jgi:NAD+ synthase